MCIDPVPASGFIFNAGVNIKQLLKHGRMLTLRKIIARRSGLPVVLAFMLLMLNQQAIACDMMMLSFDQAGQHCLKHDRCTQQMDPTKKPCCDFSFEFSAAGNQCHNDQGTLINSSLSGKLHPDYQPVFMIINLQDTFHRPQPSPLTYIPDRGPSRPGAQTYLTTQRLRI